jgi:hypothetical protein
LLYDILIERVIIMGFVKCECCEEFQRYYERNEAVRVWVRDVVDYTPANQPPFGLDGSGVFRIAEIGCNCMVLIMLNPEENYSPWREYVVKCKDIVAMRGGPLNINNG